MMNPSTTLAASSLTPEAAYHLGHDYVANGASQSNCHFQIFCDSARAAAWEEGRLSAERAARTDDPHYD